jgi:tetratricopeptide (TPR) repeat protein
MKISMRQFALSFLVLLCSTNLFANDSQYLIKEMEALRDSLKFEDPARVDLTLRLADLYFDVSIQEGKGEDAEALKKNRLKAFELYKHSLNGTDHLAKAEGVNKVKIQFQVGRLLSRLNEMKMAESYYLDILANPEAPKKMHEQSALALAEWNEEETNYPKAKQYYDRAIASCTDRNSCNYAYYRLGWLYYKDTKLDNAIVAMEKSLWTDETTIRENSLTDLMLFLSNKETNGDKEFELIKQISIKGKRPELIRLLVEAFYVAGNRLAGSNLLAELNKTDPNLYYEVRLLEEYYGFRKWEKVSHYLSILEKRKSLDIPSKAEEAKEVQTILRRFVVQVDAEMQVIPDLNTFLKRSIEVYLTLYPRDELRTKMQSGWLAIVPEIDKKLVRLDLWIKEDTANKVNPLELRKLHQTRLAIVQKEKNSKLIIEDSFAIAEILKGTKEADEFLYVGAREQYAQKKFETALPVFQKIVSNIKPSEEVGSFAILSQNLILDIYNNQKNYDGIVSQVATWKELTKNQVNDQNNTELLKENKSIDQILVQAQFEKAFLLKESKPALEAFYKFCVDKMYPEKSCPNAKVLSIKFKDQEKLVKVLEQMGDDQSLAVEFELMGRYKDAALLREKIDLIGKPSLDSFLKVAFLYELDQDLVARDRVLIQLIEAAKREKSLPENLEKLIFLTLDESNLLDERALSMGWSINQKLKLASRLEIEKPSVASRKALLSEAEGSGPVWSKVILSELEAEFIKVNAVKFYGAKSQKLFKQRTQSIEKFATMAKPMLNTSDLEARIYIIHMLKMTYKNMANEILNSPIPDGLDQATLTQVTNQISTMADPFDRANEDYDRLLNEQLAVIADPALKEIVSKNIQGVVVGYDKFIQAIAPDKAEHNILANIDHNPAILLKQKLLTEPEDKLTLMGLTEFYTKNKEF